MSAASLKEEPVHWMCTPGWMYDGDVLGRFWFSGSPTCDLCLKLSCESAASQPLPTIQGYVVMQFSVIDAPEFSTANASASSRSHLMHVSTTLPAACVC